ncbi:outer membrane beta-barrel protein [Microbulbifer agarilyticus]|uniref:outer membrane beta-barrel protein n=1 Tax=Microbulbifer agarilyticus TaxID=260552 RepID=UPI001C973C5E|nr:outer membrane beta-barrel protein [Microbulbifer agarilyticus]MBY6211618.1 outer membrane beta-barrel protein [Microbulbifer agarilyticus]
MFSKNKLALALAVSAISISAQAEDFYIGGNIGYSDMDNTATSGSFSSEFVTGPGTTLPAGVALPAGTDVGWNTNVDSGTAYSLTLGYNMGQIRFEAEYARSMNDVDSHSNVSTAGIALGSEDAGVLVTGAPDNLGVSVADLVADGRGEFDASYLFANVYYDFDLGSPFKPYIGAGIGNADVDIEYRPSGVTIINDDDSVFAYQVMAGINFDATEQLTVFGGVRWRETDDIRVNAELFDARFDMEMSSFVAELGTRFNF